MARPVAWPSGRSAEGGGSRVSEGLAGQGRPAQATQPIIVIAPLICVIASPLIWTIVPWTCVCAWPWMLIMIPCRVIPVWSIVMLFSPTLSVIDCIASVELDPRLSLVVWLPMLMVKLSLPIWMLTLRLPCWIVSVSLPVCSVAVRSL